MNKYTKIQGPRFQRNNIIARDPKSDLHGTSFQSLPKINHMLITRQFAYNKSLQHPTISVLLIKILIFFFFFFDHSVAFTCSKVINAFKRFGKALNLIFPNLSSLNMPGFDHETILSPSFLGLRKERLVQ